MAINLFRYVPSKWVGFVKDMKRLFPEFKKDPELVEHVCKILATHKPLKQVKFDDAANKAVRQHNSEVIALNEESPSLGGNVEVYNKILAEDNKGASDAVDFTIFKWEHSAMHLVAYQLMQHYKEAKENKEKDENAVHPLMDVRLSTVGISFKGHKKVENLI